MENYDKYLVTNAGRRLLSEYSLDEEGTWHILGEDPNPDMGGHHHHPDLGYLEGKLKDVIHAAVNMPKFWSWGAGGEIIKYEAPKVKKVEQLLEDNKELKKLLQQRDLINIRIRQLREK